MTQTTQHPYSVHKENISPASILQSISYKIIWVLSAIITLLLLFFQGTLWVTQILLRYSSKILFYSIIALVFITAFMLLCALYVVTFGTLHFP